HAAAAAHGRRVSRHVSFDQGVATPCERHLPLEREKAAQVDCSWWTGLHGYPTLTTIMVASSNGSFPERNFAISRSMRINRSSFAGPGLVRSDSRRSVPNISP